MASDAPMVNQRTRERWLSTKYNRGNDLMMRNMLEMLHALMSDGTQRSGIIAGMQVSVVGGTMDVSIAAGLGELYDSSVSSPDSTHRWMELAASTTATADAADATNPRWDVVEVQPGTQDTNVSRDIYDPTTNTFTPSSGVDERTSSPTFRVRAGTAAASPVLPAGVSGWIPLAYVYVPATAGSLTATDVIQCRPMLAAPHPKRVKGGGLTFVSTHATTDPQVDMLIEPIEGQFEDAGFDFSITGRPTLTLVSDSFDGSPGLPGANERWHAYACPAPYPSGYDSSMAPREFIPGSTAVAHFSDVAVAGVEGCIVLLSQTSPDVDTFDGAPSAAGNFVLSGTPFAASVNIDQTSTVYMGACYSSVANGMVGQEAKSGGHIMVSGSSGSPSYSSSSGLASTDSMWDNGASGLNALPPSAFRVLGRVVFSGSSVAGGPPSFTITDESHITNPVGTPNYSWQFAAGADFSISVQQWIDVDRANGNADFALVQNGATGTLTASVSIAGYQDAILARR